MGAETPKLVIYMEEATSDHKIVSSMEERLAKIDRRIRRLDNVKLAHVLRIESEFEDLLLKFSRLTDDINELKHSVDRHVIRPLRGDSE